MAGSDHIQRLEKAGVINQAQFSAEDRKVLENLSEDEVDTLIRLREKMGEVAPGKEHMRPNFVV